MATFYIEGEQEKIIHNDYWQIRRLQASITKRLAYKDGYMFEQLHKSAVDKFARKLRRYYFSRSREMEISRDILDLYRIYLILSPIIQRLPGSMRISEHRGHALTWVRSNVNSKVQRFWYDYWAEEREADYDRLRTNLIRAGVTDRPFLDHLEDPFFTSYIRPTWQGDLARLIFDPFMFLHRKHYGEKCLRIGNVIHRLEKKRFPGAIDLREKRGEFWDYEVQYNRVRKEAAGETRMGGVVDIWVSQRREAKFKTEISQILDTRITAHGKIAKMTAAVAGYVEDIKYAKSAFDQVVTLRRWLNDKTKKLKATEERAGGVGKILTNMWTEKQTFSRTWRAERNFFYTADVKRPPVTVYLQYFNPKREAIHGAKRAAVAVVAVGERPKAARKKTAGQHLQSAGT